MMPIQSADTIAALQADILRLQGLKSAGTAMNIELGPMNKAFPNATFPLGAVHEFITDNEENAAASCGFISGLLAATMQSNGTALWISTERVIFPPALKSFGIEPDHIVFIHLKKEKEALGVIEDALKCGALSAVVGDLRNLSFTESRRLQLAVEQSHVTGFLLRHHTNNTGTTACISRWKITSVASEPIDGLPGIGFPGWRVELLRIRNGKPGVWDVHFANGCFHVQKPVPTHLSEREEKVPGLLYLEHSHHHEHDKKAG